MKILICGGRDFSDSRRLYSFLDKAHKRYGFTLVIEGGARGADAMGRSWAKSRGIPVQTFPADWSTYGKRAGFIRNREMLTKGNPDVIIAFPGGIGTQDMINCGKKSEIPVIEIKNHE
jgi:predicted Rossmann-fold nucleotide-binding protein